MILTRVKSYLQSGEFTTCEQIYVTTNQQEALDKFKRTYPEHKDCILVAEYIDSNDTEYLNAYMRAYF